MADTAAAEAVLRAERLGSVLVLVIDAPPVNALGAALRKALWEAVEHAERDPGVTAMVLAAEGRTFPAGADITEFGKPPQPPLLPDLCNRIEACAKPVVAALHGTALGGGLELALAARGRVMARGSVIGLPEVKLGLLPGAGGTQRLPRLAGAEAALSMMLDGHQVGAEAAQAMGLADLLAEPEALLETAVALAEVLAEHPVAATRDRSRGTADPRAFAAAVAAARGRIAGSPIEAQARIVDCVEAALLLPFDQGLAFERSAFADLLGSDTSAALRHMFKAERRAGKGLAPVVLKSVVVAGAGPEGADLARLLIGEGVEVTLADAGQDRLAPGLQHIAAATEVAVGEGRLSAVARDAAWARLNPALSTETAAGPADAVVLTGGFAGGPEPPIAALRAPGAPVLRVGPGGAGQRLILPEARRLAEVVVPDGTGTAAATALARKLGRLPIVTRVPAGVSASLGATLAAAADRLATRHGRAAVEGALAQWSLTVPGLPEGGSSPARRADIARALLAALANLGLRFLGDGAVRAGSDVDVAAVHGLGWPAHVPAPMLWADRRGMLVLRADLRALAAVDPDLWQPAPLIDHLIREGLPLVAMDEG